MAPHPSRRHWISALIIPLILTADAKADRRVAVVAWADEAYTARRIAHNPPRTEYYVFMQGRRFESPTRDRHFERHGFLDIAKSLAAELARDHYEPAQDVESADLVLLVHWGTTTPRVSHASLRGTVTYSIAREHSYESENVFENQSGDAVMSQFFVDDTEAYHANDFDQAGRVANSLKHDLTTASNAALLGYTAQLRQLSRMPFTWSTEHAMRSDLEMERYFIIVKAYDLRSPASPGARARPVWTLHLNMRSPGQNFQTAVARMSRVAPEFAGRSTPGMTRVIRRERVGTVELGPLKVIGYVD
ncbi:MAG TPA: hypothetical protein VIK52_03110 [Opitutaceae bacterium]